MGVLCHFDNGVRTASTAISVIAITACESVTLAEPVDSQQTLTFLPSSQRPSGYSDAAKVRISPRTVVFIAMATAICSLRYGLRLTAVPRSTQPCIPSGSLNRVPSSAGVRAGMPPLPGGR